MKRSKYAVAYVTSHGELLLDIVEAEGPVEAGKLVIKRKKGGDMGSYVADAYKNASCLKDLVEFAHQCDEMLEVKCLRGGT